MKKVSKTSHPVPVQSGDGIIIIPACSLSITQAEDFNEVLSKILVSCKFAKFSPSLSLSTYWDSLNDSDCQTIEVDAKTLSDLQRLSGIGDNIETSVVKLIEFYESSLDLNLILLPEVIEKRPSYAEFTAQFGHTLSRSQVHYSHIKVLFNPSTSKLGIFCRRQKETTGFVPNLIRQLKERKALMIEKVDLPKTYHTNFSMLWTHLRKAGLQDQDYSWSWKDLSQSGILIELKS